MRFERIFFICYIPLTVHLGVILVNNQLDPPSLFNVRNWRMWNVLNIWVAY